MLFNFRSDRNQHHIRVHMREKKSQRLFSKETGRRCRICGPESHDYGDNRTLKQHLSNTENHTAWDLLDAGYDASLFYKKGSPEEEDVISWHINAGILTDPSSVKPRPPKNPKK